MNPRTRNLIEMTAREIEEKAIELCVTGKALKNYEQIQLKQRIGKIVGEFVQMSQRSKSMQETKNGSLRFEEQADVFVVWIRIDETLPWIELKGLYHTREEANKAAEEFLESMQIKIVGLPMKRQLHEKQKLIRIVTRPKCPDSGLS